MLETECHRPASRIDMLGKGQVRRRVRKPVYEAAKNHEQRQDDDVSGNACDQQENRPRCGGIEADRLLPPDALDNPAERSGSQGCGQEEAGGQHTETGCSEAEFGADAEKGGAEQKHRLGADHDNQYRQGHQSPGCSSSHHGLRTTSRAATVSSCRRRPPTKRSATCMRPGRRSHRPGTGDSRPEAAR